MPKNNNVDCRVCVSDAGYCRGCNDGDLFRSGGAGMKCEKCGCKGNSECGKPVQDCSLNEVGICPCCEKDAAVRRLLRVAERAVTFGLNGSGVYDALEAADAKEMAEAANAVSEHIGEEG